MEGVDLISKLPDALLADIVSLLPEAEGVRTSVLSQRWKTVWKHSSRLNFDQKQTLKPLIEHYIQYTHPTSVLLLRCVVRMSVSGIVVSATNIEVVEIDTVTCYRGKVGFKDPKTSGDLFLP
ncbi:Leucine-rich repeat domain superfamily [Sesbania bispinosa]|nr:Leucine-rich repeat domain superfamily [Sesbania bispinosa]